jgi:hypothetical protein
LLLIFAFRIKSEKSWHVATSNLLQADGQATVSTSSWNTPSSDEVDLLLVNARLRDELEPFIDESFDLLQTKRMSLAAENEFLASMLAWERAPMLPISQWFTPELKLPHPDSMEDTQFSQILHETQQKLYEQRIILDFTDHLSDRQLYCLICRDILPSFEKKIDLPRNYLHWHCLDDNDTETWLRYYASAIERATWSEETGLIPPPAEQPPFPRNFPRRPLG